MADTPDFSKATKGDAPDFSTSSKEPISPEKPEADPTESNYFVQAGRGVGRGLHQFIGGINELGDLIPSPLPGSTPSWMKTPEFQKKLQAERDWAADPDVGMVEGGARLVGQYGPYLAPGGWLRALAGRVAPGYNLINSTTRAARGLEELAQAHATRQFLGTAAQLPALPATAKAAIAGGMGGLLSPTQNRDLASHLNNAFVGSITGAGWQQARTLLANLSPAQRHGVQMLPLLAAAALAGYEGHGSIWANYHMLLAGGGASVALLRSGRVPPALAGNIAAALNDWANPQGQQP
jgi:hypothetical protein